MECLFRIFGRTSRPLFLSFCALATLLLSIPAYNIKKFYYACYSAMDFSIYQEAITRLAHFESWNPYLFVRGLHIFNDHFDPIIFLGVPWVDIFGEHPSSLLIFFFFFPLLAIFSFVYTEYKSGGHPLFLLAFILFSKAFSSGLLHPIHPVMMSSLFIFLFFYGVYREKDQWIYGSSLCLVLTKEFFPFLLLATVPYFLVCKRKREAFYLLFLSLGALFFLFVIRPRIMGPLFPYSTRITGPLLSSPLSFFYKLWITLKWKEFFLVFYPFICFFGYMSWKKKALSFKSWSVFLFLLPLFAIHLLSNIIQHWNALPFAAVFFSLILFEGLLRECSAKARWILLAIFVANGAHLYVKTLKFTLFHQSKHCSLSEERRIALKEMRSIVRQDLGKKVLMSTGLIPWSYDSRKHIYQAGEYSRQENQYDLLVFENSMSRVTGIYNREDTDVLFRECDSPKQRRLLKNKYFLMMKGPIKKSCLDFLYSKWIILPSNY